ncbi:hypothetical protein DPMN_039605 [Dreissena polymorpha]|uniref:Uncharacterized protein n=1 Tax=Dreissena polymorpha TaxID=45954 RepID=A0A9D4HSC9_DREPO|nr:hypothetical protein DPMN_039605 [Dreissena polymorpha]
MPLFVAGAEGTNKLQENLNPQKASGPNNVRFRKEYATDIIPQLSLMSHWNRGKFHQTGRRLTFRLCSKKEIVVIRQTTGLILRLLYAARPRTCATQPNHETPGPPSHPFRPWLLTKANKSMQFVSTLARHSTSFLINVYLPRPTSTNSEEPHCTGSKVFLLNAHSML